MSEQSPYDTIDSELYAAWLKQLPAEFEDICFQYRICLQVPIFELTQSRTQLGAWHETYRIISISCWLIRNHPWQTTLQVLKHEMAHQICSELFSSAGKGHGSLFQKACDMIGLTGSFCRAAADCAAGLDAAPAPSVSPSTEQARRVLAKVEKLLALAGSDNEHEAALAMQRAGELLSRHNLDLSGAMVADYSHLTLNTRRQRLPGYLRIVCSLLQKYFFVRVICASIYDPLQNARLRTIELFGRPENVAVAEHCYHFLTTKLASLWKENRHRFQENRQQARNSYFQGVIIGFYEKLETGEQTASPESKTKKENTLELLIAEDAKLQAYVAKHYPRLRKKAGRKVRLHADAYREAVATGKGLILHRVVTERNQREPRLLT